MKTLIREKELIKRSIKDMDFEDFNELDYKVFFENERNLKNIKRETLKNKKVLKYFEELNFISELENNLYRFEDIYLKKTYKIENEGIYLLFLNFFETDLSKKFALDFIEDNVLSNIYRFSKLNREWKEKRIKEGIIDYALWEAYKDLNLYKFKNNI